ncbi:IclR family transcriptional regulator [Streptomyces cupreus]|uniref:Helix-turn-helix domain-containing protein n=1 Tax=Streptomyces cupreus TaxID=2759956 RepID=A0A7X1MCT2_9ACTN|nr:IclR family transcriptional regulator C-terminal domain-containing protein [Streptomyces cupreus]MBC2906233.1 helix-turn-helix domain-containing protein [Streptomyces cupreus]
MSGPQSVDRALALLDAVADAAGPVSAKALARRVGCSLSTAYHLLGPLTERGHLVRGPRGYALGPRVPALHRSFQRQLGVHSAVGTLLSQVRRATGAETYFTAYSDGRITVVDTTAPPADDGHPFPPGPETRAHATAHGKVLLAQLPRAARRRYLTDHGMARFTARTITDAERFESEVTGVRHRGVAVSVGEADPHYTCVAVPLPGTPGRALSVSLPRAAFLRRRDEVTGALALAATAFPTVPE